MTNQQKYNNILPRLNADKQYEYEERLSIKVESRIELEAACGQVLGEMREGKDK